MIPNPAHRAYLREFSEAQARSAIDHFEEFVCDRVPILIEAGVDWEVVQDVLALMYASYDLGMQDGTTQTHEAWMLAEQFVAEELQNKRGEYEK